VLSKVKTHQRSNSIAKPNKSGDTTSWETSETFITEFQRELKDLFPPGTFVTAGKSLQEDEPDASNSKNQVLNVSFSHTASKQRTVAEEASSTKESESAGSIQMNWAIGDSIPSRITIDYVTKPWVATDRSWSHNHPKSFGFYESAHFRSNVIGFANRLARSPQEASSIAMENAIHFDSLHYGTRFSPEASEFTVVDRFQQKLSTPSGEFWQEAVLVSVRRNTNALACSAAPAPVNSAKLLLMVVAGTFGFTWVVSLVFKTVF